MGKLHEECGVFGILSPTERDVAADVYYGLFALQHRGQESCGIVVNSDGIFTSHKDEGLLSEVFHAEELARMAVEETGMGVAPVCGFHRCVPAGHGCRRKGPAPFAGCTE